MKEKINNNVNSFPYNHDPYDQRSLALLGLLVLWLLVLGLLIITVTLANMVPVFVGVHGVVLAVSAVLNDA